MSALVPWTDPGGPRCCCAGDCLVDIFEAGNYPNFVGTWQPVSESTYQQIFSGRTPTGPQASVLVTPNLNITLRKNFIFENQPFAFISTFRFVNTNIELVLPSNQQTQFFDNLPCFQPFQEPLGIATADTNIEISTLRTFNNTTLTEQVSALLRFQLSLATVNNQRYISVASDLSSAAAVNSSVDKTQRIPDAAVYVGGAGAIFAEQWQAYLLNESGINNTNPCNVPFQTPPNRRKIDVPVLASFILPGGQTIEQAGGLIHCYDEAFENANYTSVEWTGSFTPTVQWMPPPP